MPKHLGVFLSGWEYNRLMQDDPLTPRNSALPGEMLWHGSFQFWMFRKAFCTKESLDNEIAAAKILKWTTGRIFKDLVKDDFLESVDWTKLKKETKEELREIHKTLCPSDPHNIRKLIEERNVVAIESAKASLLAPILEEKNCVLGYSPSSLKNWKPTDVTALPESVLFKQFLREISAPVDVKIRGLRLCNPPSSVALTSKDRRLLRRAHEDEARMIDDLIAGEGKFAGPVGYQNYLHALEPHRSVYALQDKPMLLDWQLTREKLNRLRDAASRHLWDPLHDEWIPELRDRGPRFLAEFRKRISGSLRAHHFADLFNMNTKMVAATIGTTIGTGAAIITGDASPLHAALGTWIALQAHNILESKKAKYGSLALFYQEALGELRAIEKRGDS